MEVIQWTIVVNEKMRWSTLGEGSGICTAEKFYTNVKWSSSASRFSVVILIRSNLHNNINNYLDELDNFYSSQYVFHIL